MSLRLPLVVWRPQAAVLSFYALMLTLVMLNMNY